MKPPSMQLSSPPLFPSPSFLSTINPPFIPTATPLSSLTNSVFRLDYPERSLILKMYRSVLSVLIDRPLELALIHALSEREKYPSIVVQSELFRVEQFIQGESPTRETMNPSQLQQFATLLGEFSCQFNHIAEGRPTREVGRLYSMFRKIYEAERDNLECAAVLSEILSEGMERRMNELVKDIPLVLNHNDTYFPNILVRPEGLLLLDYEFSCLNYSGFDLGNFFNEYTSTYDEGIFRIDPHLELPPTLKDRMIGNYFTGLNGGQQGMAKWKHCVEVGRLLSHLFWAFVGVLQLHDQQVSGLDMQQYVKRRCEQFFLHLQKIA